MHFLKPCKETKYSIIIQIIGLGFQLTQGSVAYLHNVAEFFTTWNKTGHFLDNWGKMESQGGLRKHGKRKEAPHSGVWLGFINWESRMYLFGRFDISKNVKMTINYVYMYMAFKIILLFSFKTAFFFMIKNMYHKLFMA